MGDNIETEIKLHVPDLQAAEMRLIAAGAALKAPRVFERNLRYDRADGSLSASAVVLRLRQDTRVRLTYKEDLPETEKTNSGVSSRFEAEVEISDFEAMDTILRKLGYTPYMVYEKYRTTYTLYGAEVTLDELPVGRFVEVEGDESAIEQVIVAAGLGDALRMPSSYTTIFKRVQQRLGLRFTNITFANFEGVPVPESALFE
ncbi:MAG: class IV adenylate cyclase [Anaerolineae bacterium]|nr:class IV adenylate cyclase [Anaerolineae bacterium]